MPQVTISDSDHKTLLDAKAELDALKAAGGGATGDDAGLQDLQKQLDAMQDKLDDSETANKTLQEKFDETVKQKDDELAKMKEAYDEAAEENGTLTARVKELEGQIEKAAA